MPILVNVAVGQHLVSGFLLGAANLSLTVCVNFHIVKQCRFLVGSLGIAVYLLVLSGFYQEAAIDALVTQGVLYRRCTSRFEVMMEPVL